ncbi:MAG: hypothetical protein ACREBV_09960 [Candidatus Zixiibacteriota bacterium]
MSFFKGSMELPDPEKVNLPDEENSVLEKLAIKVVDRGMTVPAILFLESVKPLNYIGSQAMVFFEPLVQSIFNFKDYDTLRVALEKRETLEILLVKIESHDAIAVVRQNNLKKIQKEEKKKWKWYQRWLGIMTPKVELPDDVIKLDNVKDDQSRK